jgi:lycopene beta-cyclase
MIGVRFIVVGGGLAGSLVALALGEAASGRVTLLERDGALAGNHTWSFHESDLDDAGHALIRPLVAHRWPRYQVVFPGYARTIQSCYATIDADTFARRMMKRLGACGVDVRLGARVATLGPAHVSLEDGSLLNGDVVIDARGPAPLPQRGRAGYQKFVGLEVELGADSPWTTPLLMDATVPQDGGYRFVYVLPFSSRRVLIEDTIYADDPDLDIDAGERAVRSYAARAGARVVRVLRRETGVLPLPITDHEQRSPVEAEGPVLVGYRGGFFHPVTGYSLPLAVRLAVAMAGARTAAEARDAVADVASALAPQRRFGQFLNRLTFEALPATARRGAFERFYRLPDATIARFYASSSSGADRARILLGRPPAGISWRRLFVPQAHRPQREPS